MILDIASAILILAGLAFFVIAAIGLHRFDDVFSRLHAATKPATLGLACVLSGAALQMTSIGDATKLMLVVVLQFLTAPLGAHMVSRAAYRSGTELGPTTVLDELANAAQADAVDDRRGCLDDA